MFTGRVREAIAEYKYCLTLAAEGCKVVVLDMNGEGATETAEEIGAAGGTARGYAVQ